LSETAGTTVVSQQVDFSLSHAGHAFSGTHIKIQNPDEHGEGEITAFGRHVMMGYLGNETATREVFD